MRPSLIALKNLNLLSGMKSKRVGIVGLLQESNTFIKDKTTIEHFKEDLYLVGEEIRERMANAPHEVGGFFKGLADSKIEAVPIFLARAIPYGVIEAASFDSLVTFMLTELQRAGPLDGILTAPHGATVAENQPDADGYWLGEVRKLIGPEIPIVATIDPHANLSNDMVEATNAIIAYSTNPHLDQRDTGRQAANLLAKTLRGEIRPAQAAALLSMAINIQSQETSKSPLSDYYQVAKARANQPKVLSHSIVLGFPYSDVPEMGSSVLVVTDDDQPLAEKTALELSNRLWEQRHTFEPDFVNASKAVAMALQTDSFPVVLLDMGDNVGGGSPADGTILLAELHKQNATRSLVCIYDPEAVSQAYQAGLDGRPELSIGGKSDSLHGDPFCICVQVLSLHAGTFSETEAHHGGFTDYDQGPTAIVETIDGRITIMLTSKRVPPFSLKQLTSFGLNPKQFKIVVAKGVIAPLAAYRPIAGSFIHVDTPGVTRADMTQLSYQHRRHPMYPFENL